MNVGVLEAKNRLSELIEAVERGEEVLITKRGRPAVRLVPVDDADARRAQAHAALEEMARIGREITERNGRQITWEETRQDIDAGRR